VADAAAKAARAPDREKLSAVATRLLEMELPEMSTDEGGAIIVKLRENLNRLSAWVDARISEL
jgi:hypothetical protein